MAIQVYDNITEVLMKALASKLNAICQGLSVIPERQMTAGREGIVIYINNMFEEEKNKDNFVRTYERSYSFGITLYNQNSSDKTYIDSNFFEAVFSQLDCLEFTFKDKEHQLYIETKQASSEVYPCLIILQPHSILITRRTIKPEPDDGLAELIFIEEITTGG